MTHLGITNGLSDDEIHTAAAMEGARVKPGFHAIGLQRPGPGFPVSMPRPGILSLSQSSFGKCRKGIRGVSDRLRYALFCMVFFPWIWLGGIF
jgi:hypothetical protein